MGAQAIQKRPRPIQCRMQDLREDGNQQHGRRQRKLEHHRPASGAQCPVVRIKRPKKHGFLLSLPRSPPISKPTAQLGTGAVIRQRFNAEAVSATAVMTSSVLAARRAHGVRAK